jgi:hypothetical protein
MVEKIPKESAEDFEKKGDYASGSANSPKYKHSVKSINYIIEASKNYELAGDSRVKQYSEFSREEKFRNAKLSLLSANKDYNSVISSIEEYRRRKEIYNEKNEKKVGIEFLDEDKMKKVKTKIKSLEKKLNEFKKSEKRDNYLKGLKKYSVFPFLSIGSLLGALIFSSFSLTGYVVGQLTYDNSRWVGVVLFMMGLVFAFCHFKSKK